MSVIERMAQMIPSQSSHTESARMASGLGVATGGIGDKIRGAMAVGKTRWGMLALDRKSVV